MQEITPNTLQSLPVKLREEHTPQTGDIYLYTGCQDKEIIRLGEKEVYSPSGTQHYTRFKTESWSFAESAWKDGRRDLSLSELKNYYRLCLVPFDELIREADTFFRGDAACSDSSPGSNRVYPRIFIMKKSKIQIRRAGLKERLHFLFTGEIPGYWQKANNDVRMTLVQALTDPDFPFCKENKPETIKIIIDFLATKKFTYKTIKKYIFRIPLLPHEEKSLLSFRTVHRKTKS